MCPNLSIKRVDTNVPYNDSYDYDDISSNSENSSVSLNEGAKLAKQPDIIDQNLENWHNSNLLDNEKNAIDLQRYDSLNGPYMPRKKYIQDYCESTASIPDVMENTRRKRGHESSLRVSDFEPGKRLKAGQ